MTLLENEPLPEGVLADRPIAERVRALPKSRTRTLPTSIGMGPFRRKPSPLPNAHTACVAFGMDRLTLAPFRVHGLGTADWPGSLRPTHVL